MRIAKPSSRGSPSVSIAAEMQKQYDGSAAIQCAMQPHEHSDT